MMTRPSSSTRSIADASDDWHDVMGGETTTDIEHQPDEKSKGATRTLSAASMPLGLDGRHNFIAVIPTYAAGVEQQCRPVRQQHKPTKHQMTFCRTVATSDSRRSVSANSAARPSSVIS